jgi:hypothetical protein
MASFNLQGTSKKGYLTYIVCDQCCSPKCDYYYYYYYYLLLLFFGHNFITWRGKKNEGGTR